MSELTLTVLQLGLLVVLWLFVISLVGVLRRDLYGTRVVPREAGRAPSAAASGRAAKPPRRQQQGPTQLVVVDGALRGTSVALGSSAVLLGRAPECTLVLEDDYASTRHARVFPQDGRWFLEDLGSTNGTFLGRDRVQGAPVPVAAGQQLRVGRTVLELRR